MVSYLIFSACLLSLKEEEGELQSNSCSIYACSDPQSHPPASRGETLYSASPTLACSALRLPVGGKYDNMIHTSSHVTCKLGVSLSIVWPIKS